MVKGRRREDAETTDAPAAPGTTGEKTSRHYTVATIHPMYKKPFTVEKFNDAMLEKFLNLSEANHIPVYWVTMPVLPAVYKSRKRFKFDEGYGEFLDGLQKRHGVRVLQRGFTVLADKNFKDMTHLNAAAAEEFSRELGQTLAGLPKSKRQ